MCATYVADVWPVTSVRSQDAVQHIMIRPALIANETDGENIDTYCAQIHPNAHTGRDVLFLKAEGEDVSPTCWKMHRWGKVLEMSSLISSRLDSRSDDPASGRRGQTVRKN